MVQLTSKQLVGMLIVIIVKDSLKDCFKNVRTSAAGAGIMGVMVNTTIQSRLLYYLRALPGKQRWHRGPTSFHSAAHGRGVISRTNRTDFRELSPGCFRCNGRQKKC